MNEINTLTEREVKAEVFIPLTQGQVAVVDFDDFELVRGYSWYAKWCKHRKKYVAARSEFDPEKYARLGPVEGQKNHNKTILMHRQIAAQMGLPDVDHADLNTLNNRRNNLRPCTRSQNVANSNKRIHNTSGFKGVHWNTTAKAWAARIGLNGKRIFLGYFNTKEEAAKAYDDAAKQYFGKFSRVNGVQVASTVKPRTPHHNTTGFPGVTWNKQTRKFRARIGIDYKRIFLGDFDTAEEAAQAYNTAAQKARTASS